jgi:hypothetical protein
LAEQAEEMFRLGEDEAWIKAAINHPNLIKQGLAAYEAGFPADVPPEIVAADLEVTRIVTNTVKRRG